MLICMLRLLTMMWVVCYSCSANVTAMQASGPVARCQVRSTEMMAQADALVCPNIVHCCVICLVFHL
jgi:hypothetical protein